MPAPDTTLEGDLRSAHGIRIRESVEGDIVAAGKIELGRESRMVGNSRANKPPTAGSRARSGHFFAGGGWGMALSEGRTRTLMTFHWPSMSWSWR